MTQEHVSTYFFPDHNCRRSWLFMVLVPVKEDMNDVDSYLSLCNILVAPRSVLSVIVDVQFASPRHQNDVTQNTYIIYGNGNLRK